MMVPEGVYTRQQRLEIVLYILTGILVGKLLVRVLDSVLVIGLLTGVIVFVAIEGTKKISARV